MKKDLKAISANNDLDFYLNSENVQNPDLVIATIEYFETGQRSRYFKPLEFLNLLWKQTNFVITHLEKPDSTIKSLKALPLTPEQKHILFGFILKWNGGYPVEKKEQYNPLLQKMEVEKPYFILRLIEKEFLSYVGETPEKEFCHKNWLPYKRDIQIKTNTPKVESTGQEISKTKAKYKLSGKSGAKTDLIRILNALYELHFIEKEDGSIPTKQEFFEAFGNFLGINLSKYHANLSQTFKEQPLEVNLKIFEKMKEITQNGHFTSEK